MQVRYDNTKPHPDIETFPHHKNTPDGIVAGKEPEIDDVLSEIKRQVIKNEKVNTTFICENSPVLQQKGMILMLDNLDKCPKNG